jgi:hypothetical protein
MTKSVFLGSILTLGGLLAVSPAFALEVTYSTTGVFSQHGNNVLIGTGGATATFNAGTGDDLPSIPGGPAVDATTDSLGTMTLTVPTGGKIVGSGSFLLTIEQTIVGGPTGSSSDSAALSATISRLNKATTGDLIVTFAAPSITIDNVTYTLEDMGQNGLGANQLAFGSGGANIEAAITSPAPEPTFFALTGLGFLGLAVVAGRRYKQSATPTTV